MAKVTITIQDPPVGSDLTDTIDIKVDSTPPLALKEGELAADDVTNAQAAALLALNYLANDALSIVKVDVPWGLEGSRVTATFDAEKHEGQGSNGDGE